MNLWILTSCLKKNACTMQLSNRLSQTEFKLESAQVRLREQQQRLEVSQADVRRLRERLRKSQLLLQQVQEEFTEERSVAAAAAATTNVAAASTLAPSPLSPSISRSISSGKLAGPNNWPSPQNNLVNGLSQTLEGVCRALGMLFVVQYITGVAALFALYRFFSVADRGCVEREYVLATIVIAIFVLLSGGGGGGGHSRGNGRGSVNITVASGASIRAAALLVCIQSLLCGFIFSFLHRKPSCVAITSAATAVTPE